jgi:urease subunit alpha
MRKSYFREDHFFGGRSGAVDTQVHFTDAGVISEGLAAGVTTMFGGGTGATSATRSVAGTPGPWHLKRMIEIADNLPMNIGFAGRGSASLPEALVEQIQSGASSLVIHDDAGAAPMTIDCALTIAEQHDVQAALLSDTYNEGGFIEDTIAALKGRSIFAIDVGGVGRGHAPDVLKLCGLPNVLPSSGIFAQPYSINTIDEQVSALMVERGLNPAIPEDVALIDSCVRRETIGATDVLQDMGVISIVSSGAQAEGATRDLIRRTWQCASVLKQQRGKLPGDDDADNERVKRYIAKYTINPAIACGISSDVGSVKKGGRPGKILISELALGRAATVINPSLIKAIVRAHLWDEQLQSGLSISEISLKENVNRTYVGQVVQLAHLAPDITEAILDGRQPEGFKVEELLKPLPPAWADQRKQLGFVA